ncbi:non-canonical purine NTP pyrophosphatase [Kitasatospora acidiphila]|uniref:Non-canonical purine NTP pyrophosphatase n=1 Tax=Kitasatospora acidiphila TaxID=2567942 RepID=A0A540WCP8_9ACTN|nr:non-canonical purine NTP pyrophosphatase [Kitasatospora acidiphila]TQF06667.1 non-canonical purine NTP pyrophosphatase [Kitasatospora acidiphila]
MRRVLLASQNSIKFEEVAHIIPGVERLAVELTEVQATDVRVVVEDKLDQVARLGFEEPVIVEDTGLHLEAWNGLPGALVKWFVTDLGVPRFQEIVAASGNARARATSAVGVIWGRERCSWTGDLDGRIVEGRGDLGGWTPMFEVADTGRTLAELPLADRLLWTMRREPLQHALKWLAERGYQA